MTNEEWKSDHQAAPFLFFDGSMRSLRREHLPSAPITGPKPATPVSPRTSARRNAWVAAREQELAVRVVQVDLSALTVVHMGLHPTHG